jgi:predicted transcriptional regulator
VRRRSPGLTDGELRLMRVLWTRGRGTVADILDGLAGSRRPAYNTVLTMMRILERKGYVRHEKAGRAFVFFPLIDQAQARRTALGWLLNRFFDDSPGLLVLNLIRDGQVDPGELARLRRLTGHARPDSGGKRARES